MAEFFAKVSEGGKITVPLTVREMYNIETGDILTLKLQEVAKKEKNKKEEKT